MKGEHIEIRFWGKVDRLHSYGPEGDCWRWTGAKASGYGQIMFDGAVQYAHRVSYQLRHNVTLKPVRQDGPLVLHSCDVRDCVNPAHLSLGTNTENMQQMIARGRQRVRDNKGEANPRHKLKAPEVLAIRRDGRRHQQIADDYAICQATVSLIKTGKLWPHLPPQQKR